MTQELKKHHLLITGTGRTGTTFLVKLLTLLDFNTGFTKDQIAASKELRAGLEFQGLGAHLPYVVKNPKLMWQLPELLQKNKVVVDHILLPMRDIHAAAESRRENVRKSDGSLAPQEVVGGLEGVDNPADQEGFFLRKFYDFLQFVSLYQIPLTTLQYPRLVLDGEYLYLKLRPLLGQLPQGRFMEVFNELSDSSMVHCYTSADGYRVEYDETENIRRLHAGSLETGDLLQLQERLVRQHSDYRRKENTLRHEALALRQENQSLRQEQGRMQSSRSWRYTRPCRMIMALLRRDKRYIYDAIQRVRTRVWIFRNRARSQYPRLSRFGIEPLYIVVKKWLKPALQKIACCILSRSAGDKCEDYQVCAYLSDYQENQDFSSFSTEVRAIAFYLPQYHRIPENDRWWGEGFTEWTNTQKAKPLFDGHYQPREPHQDFGYYDLSNLETLKKQAALAKQHGIFGFCFYHYYFHGKRLLEKPIEMLLEHPEIDLRFCVCWANESWTKKWDGADHEILIGQAHSPGDDLCFIRDLSRYLKDPRYIRCGDKPVILVYRPLLLPEPRATFQRWRQYCRDNQIGEIAIWGVRGCFNQDSPMGLEDAMDAEVEFPPHLTVPFEWISSSKIKNSKLKSPLVNYQSLVKNILAQESIADRLTHPIYRTAMLGWDNTSRQKEMGRVFWGFSLAFYYKWLRYNIESVERKFNPDKRFVFINAWNEWAEGTYLEPDKKYGYAAINTTSKALFDLPFLMRNPGLVNRNKTDSQLRLNDLIVSRVPNSVGKVAVHAHIYYADLTDEMIFYMNNIPVEFDCYVTTDSDTKSREIQNKIGKRLNACRWEVRVTPNVGRDVAPFLVGCRDIMKNYDYVCHIHTKKSIHGSFGEHWREHLFDHLLGSSRLVGGILSHFHENPSTGLIYPAVFDAVRHQSAWGANEDKVKQLLSRVGTSARFHKPPAFPAGTMAWLRTRAFTNLFEAGITYEDFEKETGQLDGTLAHAVERSLIYIAEGNGFAGLCLAG